MDAQPETATGSEEKHSFNWRAFILWPVVILILYVLSVGPVLMMLESGHIARSNQFVGDFYRPLEWAYHETALHKPLGMYLHLWVPNDFDKNGDLHYLK